MEPTIYLFFKGNCLEAMNHYAKTLDGEIGDVFHNADAPNADDRMPGGDELIMNMSIQLGQATIMASDSPPDMYDEPKGFRVSISPTSLSEFERIYKALAKDAKEISMPPSETFWAERFAMFDDKYGTPWMLNYEGVMAQK